MLGRSMLLPAEPPAGWEELGGREQRAIARPSKRESSKGAGHARKPGGWAAALKPGMLRKLTVLNVVLL